MDRKPLTSAVAILGMTVLTVACATSRDVTAKPLQPGVTYHSAYLVAHGDRSSDVDASIQRELFRRGLTVSAGPDGRPSEAADLTVRYADSWSWDMAMYLKTLDIQIYDARSGTLLAVATWKNSALHGFYGLDKVVAELISEMFAKLGMKSPQ